MTDDEKRDFDKEAATWDLNPGRVALVRDVAKAIREEIPLPPDMDVLDFGCGTGLLTLALHGQVRSMTATDSSQGMLDALDAKLGSLIPANVRTKRLDFDQGDDIEERFDLITGNMVLHHVKDTRGLLTRLRRYLRPAGLLCLCDLDPEQGRFHDDPVGVFHHGFDRGALAALFREAGFSEVRSRDAATLAKPDAAGIPQTYSIFLMLGRNP